MNVPIFLFLIFIQYWRNYASYILEPFPQYDIGFRKYGNQILFRISNPLRHPENEQYIGDSSGSVIPKKYRDVRLLNSRPHPVMFLYLLSSDFDLYHFDLYWPKENELPVFEKKNLIVLFKFSKEHEILLLKFF